MKDYARRSAKFIIYILLIFFVVLGLYPLLKYGTPLSVSMQEMIANSRFTTLFVILMVYGLLYPMVAFVNHKRYLNGSYDENRDMIEKVFQKLDYIKVEERPGYVAFRKKTPMGRLTQWYEDKIAIDTTNNPLIMNGFRKRVNRIDRLMDIEISARRNEN
jgi:hypothetical protein